MLTKPIKYVDFNGVEREEDFSFNLMQSEITEMQLSKQGGLAEYVNRIIKAQDAPQLIRVFKELILKAYGTVSEDGKRFIKSEEMSEAFAQTNAYSKLFTELASDDRAAAEFINGILPPELLQDNEAELEVVSSND